MDKTIEIKNKILESIQNHKSDLEMIVAKINNIKKEIEQLNMEGVKLTAEANVLWGKIEALEALNIDNEVDKEE